MNIFEHQIAVIQSSIRYWYVKNLVNVLSGWNSKG